MLRCPHQVIHYSSKLYGYCNQFLQGNGIDELDKPFDYWFGCDGLAKSQQLPDVLLSTVPMKDVFLIILQAYRHQ